MIAKLKSLEKGQRLQYFKDYYLLKCIAVLLVICFAISLGKDVYNNSNIVMNISFANSTIEPDGISFLKEDFKKDIKLSKRKNIAVGYAGSIKYAEDANNAYTLSNKLVVGDPDVLIVDENGYRTLAYSKPFLNFEEDFKDDEEIQKIMEKYGVRNTDIDGNVTYIDAIDISDTNFVKNYIRTNDDSKIYFTVAVASAHLDYVKQLIKFLEES